MMSGILVYSVVLGFFNDYTDLLHTGTYSVTFSMAIVMQVLTYLTLRLKDWVVTKTRRRYRYETVVKALSVWLVIFPSKFVFLWVISIVFSGEVQISGFIGLIIIIITTTIATQILTRVYVRLGDLDAREI